MMVAHLHMLKQACIVKKKKDVHIWLKYIFILLKQKQYNLKAQ